LQEDRPGTTDATGAQKFAATASGAPRVRNYTYDENGKLLTADGPRTDVADVTTYQYQAADGPNYRRGDLWKITNAAGHMTEVLRTDSATGRPVEIMDPNGVVTLLTYDARGRLSSAQVAQEITGFQYDAAGNLAQITAPGGSALQYTYDDASRLTRISDSTGNYIQYTLDAAGNRTAEKAYDATGALKRTLSRTFDVLGRVQQLTGIE
jgi:YD repeat-containing protein